MSIKLFGYAGLGLLSGLIAGSVPLIWAKLREPCLDPFDHGFSYLTWLGLSSVAALGLAYVWPRQRWLSALAVFSGFVSSMILEIVIDSYTGRYPHNLWPLTVALTMVIGAPPAFTGGYFGAKLRRGDGAT